MSLSRKAVVGLLVGLLVIAGCSSSSTSSTGTTTPSSPGSAAGAPIKIGLLGSFSSATAVSGSNLVPGEDEVKAWVQSVNASGGIKGHPVDLTIEDDATNPATALTDAQTLVSDHVVAVIDLSQVDSAFGPTLQSAGIPVVGAILPAPEPGTNPDFFPEGQTNASSYYAIARLAKEAGAKNLGLIYCAEAIQCAELVSPMRAIAKTVGVPVTYTAEISATAPNYTAQCLAAQQAHVQALYIGEPSVVAANFITDCSQQGYDPMYAMNAAAYSPVLNTTPGVNNHLWIAFEDVPSYDTSLLAVKAANATMDKQFPGVRHNKDNFIEMDFQAWVATQLLETAVKAGGLTASATPSTTEVLNGLYSLHGDTLDGLAPPLTFTKGKANNINCWFTARVQNNVPTLQNNGNNTCESN